MREQTTVWRRADLAMRMVLPLLFLALHGASCSMLERHPSSLPDYDNSNGFILDYKAGERFETLKPMFITRPTIIGRIRLEGG